MVLGGHVTKIKLLAVSVNTDDFELSTINMSKVNCAKLYLDFTHNIRY